MCFVRYGLARSDDGTASPFQTMSYCLSREIFVLCRPSDDKRVWSIARTSAKHENQNHKNFFWRGNTIFVKIWISENFPLYGRREKVLPLPMWPGRLRIRLGLGLEYEAEEKRLEHVKYLVTGGGTCGILFDVVSIAAMKQRLCTDTTKIHARTPGTTARPLEEKKKTSKKTKCNIRTSVARALESLPFPLLFFLPAGMARLSLLPPAAPLSSLLLLSLLLSFSLSTSSTACLSTVGGGGRGGRPLGTVTMVTCECRGET